jgi:hypothetical protein
MRSHVLPPLSYYSIHLAVIKGWVNRYSVAFAPRLLTNSSPYNYYISFLLEDIPNISRYHIHLLTLDVYSTHLSPNFSASIRSSTSMNIFPITTTKTGMIKKGLKVPIIIAIPRRMKIIPRYIGCLLILKTPVVISAVDSLNGFTVVLNVLNDLSAIRLRTTPIKSGTMPMNCHG